MNIAQPRAQEVPLYDCYGVRIGNITIKRALKMHGTDLQLRAKGYGVRRRFTSAKMYARNTQLWQVRPSAGFSVLQFVTQ